jgi:hypothetical protein
MDLHSSVMYDAAGRDGQVLDPLAYWGTLSGYRGFLQEGGVRVAIELDLAAGPALLAWLNARKAPPAPLHKRGLETQSSRFVCAVLPPADLPALAALPGVRALMPGFIGGERQRRRSAMSAAASTQQLRRTPAERAQLVHELRRAMAHGPAAAPLQNQGVLEHLNPEPAVAEPESRSSSAKDEPPLMGVIDFGGAFLHPALARPVAAGTAPRTRILRFWDQGRSGRATSATIRPSQVAWPWEPETQMGYGRVADAASLDQLAAAIFAPAQPPIAADDWRLHEACYLAAEMPELLEPSSHGTAVLGLSAGATWPGAVGTADDAAAQADILFVQLPQDAVQDFSGGWLTAYLLDALAWLDAEARRMDRRMVVNISLGTHAGPHDGSSLVERLLDHHAEQDVLVLAAGNAAGRRGHAEARLTAGAAGALHWVVPERDPTQSFLEIWYRADGAVGEVHFGIEHDRAGPVHLAGAGATPLRQHDGTLAGAVVHVPPHAGQPSGRLWMALAPTKPDAMGGAPVPLEAPGGTWRLTAQHDGPGVLELHAWVERDEPGQTPLADRPDSVLVAPAGSAWKSTDCMTLTAQASASGPLAVGGRVADRGRPGASPAFRESGRGPTRGLRADLDAWADADERVRSIDRGLPVLGNHSGPDSTDAARAPRARGTSLAAPQVVRALYNRMVVDPSLRCSADARRALQQWPDPSAWAAPEGGLAADCAED